MLLSYKPLHLEAQQRLQEEGCVVDITDFLDSCAGSGLRERTIEQAEKLLNNILKNYDDWTLPEPLPKPTPKKRGILFLSPEDMQKAKRCMKEKGIKVEDLKILLPPFHIIMRIDLLSRFRNVVRISYFGQN